MTDAHDAIQPTGNGKGDILSQTWTGVAPSLQEMMDVLQTECNGDIQANRQRVGALISLGLHSVEKGVRPTAFGSNDVVDFATTLGHRCMYTYLTRDNRTRAFPIQEVLGSWCAGLRRASNNGETDLTMIIDTNSVLDQNLIPFFTSPEMMNFHTDAAAQRVRLHLIILEDTPDRSQRLNSLIAQSARLAGIQSTQILPFDQALDQVFGISTEDEDSR
jgi:hypothetical protein